jgi:hypothetical protein
MIQYMLVFRRTTVRAWAMVVSNYVTAILAYLHVLKHRAGDYINDT